MKPIKDGKVVCPRCGSDNVQSRGMKHGKRSYQCQEEHPGRWFKIGDTETNGGKCTERVEETKDTKEIHTTTPTRITNLQQLISHCEIDTDTWEIERWVCNKWEVGALQGPADNKVLMVEPLFQVKVWLRKKTNEVNARDVIREMVEDAKSFAPKYPKVKYPKRTDGLLYEIDMADLHFGKLTWAQETGQDYDISIAEEAAIAAFEELLGFVSHQPIEKILLPLGNDFFNVNGAGEFTVNGTRQIEDTRWQKTFTMGRKLLVKLIDLCSYVAPVDVLIVPGNHDRERMFYAGDALECWYHNNQSVTVNNQAKLRKYYEFGVDMVMFTHGSEEKFNMIPGIMALEEPEMWGRAKHREAHVGDRHHKETLKQNAKEIQGVTIRLMRSLTPADEWHYRTGWIGAEQAAESYLWHPQNGVIGQFTSVRV